MAHTMRQLDGCEDSQGENIVHNVRLGESVGNNRIVETTTVTTTINPHSNNGFLEGDDTWKDLQ